MEKRGYIDRDDLRAIVERAGLDLLFMVVEPMDRFRFYMVRSGSPVSNDELEKDLGWYSGLREMIGGDRVAVLRGAPLTPLPGGSMDKTTA